MLLPQWAARSCPVIGMLHAPPLPGSPEYRGDLSVIVRSVLQDAEALVDGGVDGLMLENFGDSPFYPRRVPAVTVAAMTLLGSELNRRFPIPFGINVLRNDGQSALAVALACGASFIRVNILCGARVADQGVIEAIAHDLLRDRTNLGANSIRIWADIDVKHSVALAERPLSAEVHDLIDRGKSDAVIVSGESTGQPVAMDTLRIVKSAAKSSPVLIGSGITVDTVPDLVPFVDGIIAGTCLKQDENAQNPVDLGRVKQLVAAVQTATKKPSQSN